MIERYQLPEMGRIWSTQNRLRTMLDVEKAVARAQASLGIIPDSAAKDIDRLARFDEHQILEIEKTTKHDVIAFVTNVAASVGENGRYVHFGLTSSDVLDTALSLQIKQAHQQLMGRLSELESALADKVTEHRDTLCAGRTHGMHAEPTTLGLKLAGFLAELRRNIERVRRACEQAEVVKLSGAVGTYSSLSPDIEKQVAKDLAMQPETIATQVIPRDRHAEIFCALALLGSGFERLAVELRHLQRTEVGELEEAFSKGQKGSSAMPHKKNPIASENVTGIARLLRGYLVSALEDVVLWHERDISHSSVERVIFPDSFILADYAASRLTQVINGLQVNDERMKKNIASSGGRIFSSHVLLLLIEKGMTRERAYEIVQRASHSLKDGETLQAALEKDLEVGKIVTRAELQKIFSGESHRGNIHEIIKRVMS